jgi:dienelactone hydrolase
MKIILQLAVLCALLSSAVAAIKVETIEYKQGDATLEGLLVYDDAITSKRPGVLIAHQWKGVGDYERKRAEMLAKMGYVAFAADVYGKGTRPADAKTASETSAKYKGDRELLGKRIQAGLDQLRKSRRVDSEKIAAIGYCFGGTTVLELARSGADVAGVVSFHGGLATPTPGDAKSIQGKVLVCHGADDPFVPSPEVLGFEEEMRKANVDWQMISYGNAVHSFTDWNAGNDNSKGAAYNEKADKRSWRAMQDFLDELFPRPESSHVR